MGGFAGSFVAAATDEAAFDCGNGGGGDAVGLAADGTDLDAGGGGDTFDFGAGDADFAAAGGAAEAIGFDDDAAVLVADEVRAATGDGEDGDCTGAAASRRIKFRGFSIFRTDSKVRSQKDGRG